MTDDILKTAQAAATQALKGGARPEVRAVFDSETNSVTYVVWDPATRACAVIDSVLGFDSASGRTSTARADEVCAVIADEGLKLAWILETHVHADHLSAAPVLQERLGGLIGIGAQVRVVQDTFGPMFHGSATFDRSGFDRLFEDGETFALGELRIMALAAPGHTPADLVYLIGDAAFVGDTLFMPDFGTARTDFPGGSAPTLYRSIRRILDLPLGVRLFTAHDYKAPGREVFAWETTVADQRAGNVHVRDGQSEADFVAFRTKRDAALPFPRLIWPALQVNLNGGRLPAPGADGRRRLVLPIDAL